MTLHVTGFIAEEVKYINPHGLGALARTYCKNQRTWHCVKQVLSVCFLFRSEGTHNITLAKRNRKRHTVLPLPSGILATTYPGIRAQASQHKKDLKKGPQPLTTCHQFSSLFHKIYDHPQFSSSHFLFIHNDARRLQKYV